MSEIVQEHSYLTLHYRISLASGAGKGKIFIDTFSGRPATLQLGVGQWISAMEKPLLGHQVGDEFDFILMAEQAYGVPRPDLIQKVTRSALEAHTQEENPQYSVGDMLEFSASDGVSYSGLITQVHDDWVEFDFNHPLAGKDIKVDVKLLGIL